MDTKTIMRLKCIFKRMSRLVDNTKSKNNFSTFFEARRFNINPVHLVNLAGIYIFQNSHHDSGKKHGTKKI